MTSALALPLDHLVINTHFEMNAAQSIFEQLGFTLTPRGRHRLACQATEVRCAKMFLKVLLALTDSSFKPLTRHAHISYYKQTA